VPAGDAPHIAAGRGSRSFGWFYFGLRFPAMQQSQGSRPAVLAAAGLGIEHLVKVNTFLTERSQLQANRAVRRRMLQNHEPASTVMVAETVDGKWLLEIEAIAAE
jgi:enamine deaminase RidA (YjgF/YER057c/UK114 family)